MHTTKDKVNLIIFWQGIVFGGSVLLGVTVEFLCLFQENIYVLTENPALGMIYPKSELMKWIRYTS